MNAKLETIEDTKSGTVVAQRPGNSLARTHQKFWEPRLQQRDYINGAGVRVLVPTWQVRMQHLGRREWFNTHTANQAAAAIKARDIYLSLVSAGWEATLVRFKPDPLATAEACTLGEFLNAVQKCSHLRPRTVRIYATKLRKLVSDVAKLEAGMRKKAKRAKFDYHHGGRTTWLAMVDGQPLDVLTPDTVTAWRNSYVARVGADPVKRKSAERSAASILRAGRALFAQDVVDVLKVKLPASPFAGVKFRDPGPQRYHSEVNPELLLASAERDLRRAHPQQYLGLFLCLWAGLRRREADLLMWKQVDLEQGQIYVRRTEHFEPKTEESERMIDLPAAAVEVLRTFKKGSKSEFVLEGSDPDPEATYAHYRCDCMWRDLVAWLKSKGVRQRNAVHVLRKESGSLIASSHGIEAARQHLGHRDIRTTSSHYVDKKKRVEVQIGAPTLRAAVGAS